MISSISYPGFLDLVSFIGSEAVDFMVGSHLAYTRTAAVDVSFLLAFLP